MADTLEVGFATIIISSEHDGFVQLIVKVPLPVVVAKPVTLVGVHSMMVLVPLALAVPVLLPLTNEISAVVMAFTEMALLAVAVKGKSTVMKI